MAYRTNDETIYRVLDMKASGMTNRRIASEVGLNYDTVSTIVTGKLPPLTGPLAAAANPVVDAVKPRPAILPAPAPEAGGPTLPDPSPIEYEPFVIDVPGTWGVLSDVHIPFHDKATIERFVEECLQRNVAGILLNGDVLDCYQLSDHCKEPTAPRMREEIMKGRQFLEWLRSKFPAARIVYKEGNHDDRLKRYLAQRAPDIYDLEDVWLPNLLRIPDVGAEWVGDKRVIMVGKLPVVHGHEYPGGGGVMPARWMHLRTGGSVLCGHFHHPTYFPFRTITNQEIGCWSTGCACFLSPAYRPLNQWAHGWAVIEIFSGGAYHVHNRRLLKSGQIA